MTKARRAGFSKKRRRGGRKTVKRRVGRRRSRGTKRRGGVRPVTSRVDRNNVNKPSLSYRSNHPRPDGGWDCWGTNLGIPCWKVLSNGAP